jgi:two-component system response regulator AtoC
MVCWRDGGSAPAGWELELETTANKRGTVLLAEDEEDLRDLLAIEVAEAGYDVMAVSSGAAAVEAIQRNKVDLVITDYKMPGMDGLETAKRMKAIDPNLPIVVTTGYAAEDMQQEFAKFGVRDFLMKPFELIDVLETTRRAIRNRSELEGRPWTEGRLERR